MSAVATLSVGETVVDGRYAVGARLGSGSNAVVYEAVRRADGAALALKWLDAVSVEHPEWYEEEVRTLRHLAADDDGRPGSPHRHVAALLDTGYEPRRHAYLVFETCRGGDLLRRMQRSDLPPLRTDEVLSLGAQLLRALALLRRRGVVHGDVKPANLLLRDATGAPHLVLADFGLSVRRRALLHACGTEYCTAWYRAPELQLGLHDSQGEYAPWHPLDMWSFGCTFFELLSGGRVLLPAGGTRDLLHLQWLVCGRPSQAYLDRCALRDVVLEGCGSGLTALRWQLHDPGHEHRRVHRDRADYWQPAVVPASVPLMYYPHAGQGRLRLLLRQHARLLPEQELDEFMHGVLALEPDERWTPTRALASPLLCVPPLAAGVKRPRDDDDDSES